jgi:hypothetical protein
MSINDLVNGNGKHIEFSAGDAKLVLSSNSGVVNLSNGGKQDNTITISDKEIGFNGDLKLNGDILSKTPTLKLIDTDFTSTEGDLTLTKGDLTLTQGDLTLTKGDFTMKNGDFSLNGQQFAITELTAGTGITTGTNTFYKGNTTRRGSIVTTEIYIDVSGLDNDGSADDIIGKAGGTANCHIGKIDTAIMGALKFAKVECLEAPVSSGGNAASADINIVLGTVGTNLEGGAVTGEQTLIDAGGNLAIGTVKFSDTNTITNATNGKFMYLIAGAASAAGTYTRGKLLITLIGTL